MGAKITATANVDNFFETNKAQSTGGGKECRQFSCDLKSFGVISPTKMNGAEGLEFFVELHILPTGMQVFKAWLCDAHGQNSESCRRDLRQQNFEFHHCDFDYVASEAGMSFHAFALVFWTRVKQISPSQVASCGDLCLLHPVFVWNSETSAWVLCSENERVSHRQHESRMFANRYANDNLPTSFQGISIRRKHCSQQNWRTPPV